MNPQLFAVTCNANYITKTITIPPAKTLILKREIQNKENNV